MNLKFENILFDLKKKIKSKHNVPVGSCEVYGEGIGNDRSACRGRNVQQYGLSETC